jgi:hypothetical protein
VLGILNEEYNHRMVESICPFVTWAFIGWTSWESFCTLKVDDPKPTH